MCAIIDPMDWHNPVEVISLVDRLRALPQENEWVEFKTNNANPDEIGEYIACLANSAALSGQETA